MSDKKTKKDLSAANPFPLFHAERAQFHQELDKLFESFLGGRLALPEWARQELNLPNWFAVNAPDIDEAEDEIAYHITADLPGMDSNDVEVTFADGILRIKGEKKAETETGEKNYYRKERSYGSFERAVNLPGAVDEAGIEAAFEKGVLTITLPKAEDPARKVKKIEVKKG